MSPECFVFIVVVGAASGLIYAVSKFKWRKASEGNVVAMVIDRTMNPTYPFFNLASLTHRGSHQYASRRWGSLGSPPSSLSGDALAKLF